MNLNRCIVGLIGVCMILLTSCAKEPRIKVETEFGDMIIELRDDTPLHKENILKLANEGFYDDLLFHRVMPNFMIQGGDPTSKDADPSALLGMGGPGYTIPAEFTGGIHIKGAVAAARMPDSGNPEKASSGSQFYIVHGTPINANNVEAQLSRNRVKAYTPEEKQAYLDAGAGYPSLDNEYTIFGQVVEGLDVIDKIAAQQIGRANRPVKDIKMKVSVVN